MCASLPSLMDNLRAGTSSVRRGLCLSGSFLTGAIVADCSLDWEDFANANGNAKDEPLDASEGGLLAEERDKRNLLRTAAGAFNRVRGGCRGDLREISGHKMM